MKLERRTSWAVFVLCLVVAMPSAWGATKDREAAKLGRTRTVKADVSDRQLICHIPRGNPSNRREIWVGEESVFAHLVKGDHLGSCYQPCPTTGQSGSNEPCLDGAVRTGLLPR